MDNTANNMQLDWDYKILEKFKLEKMKQLLTDMMDKSIDYIGEANKNDPLL